MLSRAISFGRKLMMMDTLGFLTFGLETMNFMVGCQGCLVITRGKELLQFKQVRLVFGEKKFR